MADLTTLLSKDKTTFIELGVVQSFLGAQAYVVAINGIDRKVYSTFSDEIPIRSKVIVSSLISGKRFIINKTGYTGNSIISQEVYIDG